MTKTIIQAKNLTRSFERKIYRQGFWGRVRDVFSPQYEQKTAVNQVNLSINEGEFIGFIGPNGAGKTTTLKMMTGLLSQQKGVFAYLARILSSAKVNFLKKSL